MHKGVRAEKYNYCDLKHQSCYIWFDSEFKSLYWKSSSKLFSFKSSIKLDNIQGLIFGAFSSSFSAHQKYVLNYDKFKDFTSIGTMDNRRARKQNINTTDPD